MKRIVYCVAVGKPRFGEMAMGLGRSLKLIGDKNHRVIVTDIPGFDWHRCFDEVLPPAGPRSALDKLTALERTDADQVLSIDVDMLAFKKLDDIFEYCAGKPFTVQGFMREAGRFHGVDVKLLLEKYGQDQFPNFNGGMAYYERSPVYEELLKHMRWAEANYGELGFEWFRGAVSEEVCMAHAMMTMRYFELIPNDLEFQHSAAGLIGELNLDVLKNECSFIARQHDTRFWRPYIFHAWRYKDFLVYWRELDKLKWIEEVEDSTESMFLPRPKRYVRSLHRRLLKLKNRA